MAMHVKGVPALSRRHIYADGHPRRISTIGVCGRYAEGRRRLIASENLKCHPLHYIYLLLSIN
jgi:hypothetical protein